MLPINTEKQERNGELIRTIKGFAEGTFSKNSVGLELTLTGHKDENSFQGYLRIVRIVVQICMKQVKKIIDMVGKE